jgi:hypothetical protein
MLWESRPSNLSYPKLTAGVPRTCLAEHLGGGLADGSASSACSAPGTPLPSRLSQEARGSRRDRGGYRPGVSSGCQETTTRRGTVRAARTVGHFLPARVTPPSTSRKPRRDAGGSVGAGNRDRTGDIQLGKIGIGTGDGWGSLGTGLRIDVPSRTQSSPSVPKTRREQSANSSTRKPGNSRLIQVRLYDCSKVAQRDLECFSALSNLSPVPRLNVPEITVMFSVVGCQCAPIL